jgi:murein DD-endopeptidase MepM/ murein hydrolase activator NlpD
VRAGSRLAVAAAVLLATLAGSAAADRIDERKQAVDARIAHLQQRLGASRAREDALESEIGAVDARIVGLQRQVGDATARLEPLERELELREVKLNRLNALFQLQSERLAFLRHEYRTELARLNERLVAAYESDEPRTLDIVLSSASFTDLLDRLDYAQLIIRSDRRISAEVTAAKIGAAAARALTKETRATVESQARVIAVRVHEARVIRDALLAGQSKLIEARDRKRVALDVLHGADRGAAEEIDSLQAVSADLAAKIRQAQSRSIAHVSSGTPSASGFIWPVSAPITSPFGWRWGRLHEGIDLGAAYGTPIGAAGAGVVTWAGWEGGYGNLVVIDHGGGIATAYGHQSQIAVSVGQTVARGHVIGYVGSTGHSTGPHLHFEVRVGGQAVDPLGYL